MGDGLDAVVSVLLDTHVLLWWQADGRKLSAVAAEAIAGADAVLLSPLTFWEVGTLTRLRRIELDRPVATWVHDLLGQPRITVAPLSPEAAAWAAELGGSFPGDPIDRMLYATCRDLRVPLVSKDERLRSFAANARDIEIVW